MRLTDKHIEERISKLQGFIDGISSFSEKLPREQAVQNNLFFYQGLLVMIQELYELHADRKLLFKALTLALKTDQEKNRDKAEVDEIINQLHGEIRRVDKDLKEVKINVQDLIKKTSETSR
jgi:type I restriction-modification system DNA methylase subunit